MRQERASEVFLNSLSQLLASGEVLLDDDMRNPRVAAPGVTAVGYHDANLVYLLPEVAYREAKRV